MLPATNEREFAGAVASIINNILAKDKSLPFATASCERMPPGSSKLSDLSLIDHSNRVVLNGEIKLPYRKDGGSPYNASLIQDARKKAIGFDSQYYFTWNVNQFVLWEIDPDNEANRDEKYAIWTVTKVGKREQLELSETERQIEDWWRDFLHRFTQIYLGQRALGRKAPDEQFIDELESALSLPIHFAFDALNEQYKKPRMKSDLDKWMREEQGWIITDDRQGIKDNLERAAKFTCYAVVNKLVFHEALLKRYPAKIDQLEVPEHIKSGEDLSNHLEKY
ncbi:MAG: SAM-dependent methyltransferase, partial [Proteobacteria bacterium]|nr:SAM-dependent methyltransferase [Pseudomonadota bacterium]